MKTASRREPKKAKPTEKRSAIKHKMYGPYAQTIEQNLSHLRSNIQATVPGMLDTDDLFRRLIVDYLIEFYAKEIHAAAAGFRYSPSQSRSAKRKGVQHAR